MTVHECTIQQLPFPSFLWHYTRHASVLFGNEVQGRVHARALEGWDPFVAHLQGLPVFRGRPTSCCVPNATRVHCSAAAVAVAVAVVYL